MLSLKEIVNFLYKLNIIKKFEQYFSQNLQYNLLYFNFCYHKTTKQTFEELKK